MEYAVSNMQRSKYRYIRRQM